MSLFKKMMFYVGNGMIGIVTCLLYLYFWVAFSFGFSIWTWKAASSFFISIPLFILWNWFFLRKHREESWVLSILVYLGTIIVFVVLLKMDM